MPARLKLKKGQKLPFLYNISQGVGFNQPNLPDDVQLLQVIFAEIVPHLGVGSLKPYPQLTGIYDTILGFWIFRLQEMIQTKIDGIVSPVTGDDMYTGGKYWTLAGLNLILKSTVPNKYEKLHEDPRLSMNLRNAIKP